MTDFTKKAIKDTFVELLEEYPLNEITVKSLVKACGINRNSFYYHYHDISSLIDEIIKEEADLVIEKYHTVASLNDCLDAMTEFATYRKKAIMHIYRSVNRDVFEYRMMQVIQYFIEKYINTALTDEKIDEENKALIVSYYKCLCFGILVDWLNSGLKEEKIGEFKKMFKLKLDMASEIAKRFRSSEIALD